MNNVVVSEAGFIIASPFQALCAIEAINTFKINNADIFIYDDKSSSQMTIDFLHSKGFDCEVLVFEDKLISIIKKYYKHKRYKYFFVGDYFNGQFIFTLLWTKLGAKIIYLDDGNSTLSLLPPLCRKRLHVRSKFKTLLYEMLVLLKDIKRVHRSFFTVYDVENLGFPYPIIKNSFSSFLEKGNCIGGQHGIYIIGTNLSAIGWTTDEYLDDISAIIAFSHKKFAGQNIYYCPHRRDNNDYSELLNDMGVLSFNTKVSVEVDFVSEGLNPMAIFGFGSTALFTLNLIYPQSNIYDIIFHSDDDNLVAVYRTIESEYVEKGINVVDIENLKFL